jgi:thiol-disulfide isomerase/thioredoxin
MMLGLEVLDERPPAAPFELPAPDGRRVSLAAYTGQVVLVNFWATWCGPCRAEMPSMERLYQELRPQGFAIIAVDYRETRDQVAPFVQELGLTFPVALDEDGSVGDELYPIVGLPTSYLVDRRGRVVARKVGYLEWDGAAARALIETLLAEPATPS